MGQTTLHPTHPVCCEYRGSVSVKETHRRKIGCFSCTISNVQHPLPPLPPTAYLLGNWGYSRSGSSLSAGSLQCSLLRTGRPKSRDAALSHPQPPAAAPRTLSCIQLFGGLGSSSHLPISSPPTYGGVGMLTLFQHTV